MTEFMRNGPGRTILDIQTTPGETWQILDPNAEAAAFSGGRQAVASEWGRNSRGEPTFLGTSITGNPERITINVSQRLEIQKALQNALLKLDEVPGCGCEDDGLQLRIRIRCGDIRDLNNYEIAQVLLDSHSTSQSSANNMANSGLDGSDQVQSLVEAMSAGLQVWQKPLIHNNIQGTVTDIAINKIVWRCGDEYWFVTDADSTPGYLSQPTPTVWYTEDAGATWTGPIYVGPMLNGNGLDLVIVGANVLVASPTNGVAYAPIASIKDGVTNPNLWALSTGFTGTNFPNALAVSETNTVWAVGNGGYVYKSTDGGYTFSVVSAGTVTVQNLTCVAFDSDELGWIGGAAGTLLRYYRGTLSAITSGVAVAINTVAIPERRGGDQVYVGTAGGQVRRSKNALKTTPTWTTLGFPQSGNGQIEQIQFVGFKGQYMFVLQSDNDNDTRILRDNSGGAMGANVEIIGDFQSPENNGINALAMSTPNTGLCVGEIINTYGYIGSING